jgi:hypothetical protein
MPSFKEAGKLSDTEIKKLAVYVYKFGGGQLMHRRAAAPAAELPSSHRFDKCAWKGGLNLLLFSSETRRFLSGNDINSGYYVRLLILE